MAENPVVGKAPLERQFERIEVVDSLADEGAFLERVLIDVRDRAGIGINARFPAMQARVARLVGARQADAHARLQDAVACANPLPDGVENRTVQRVRHGADELVRGVARQLGIRIEGDHVFHAGERACRSDHQGEGVTVAVAVSLAQQNVQVPQFAALALVAHPYPVAWIPAPRTMKQEEEIVSTTRVLRVKAFDSLPGQLQQCRVLGQFLLLGVTKVGQQAEVQIRVAIGQESHLKCLDQTLDVAQAGEHGRDDHQGARFRRDARRIVHARQRTRRSQKGDEPIHQRDGKLTGGQQGEDGQQRQHPIRVSIRARLRQQTSRQQQRDQRDRAEIQHQGKAARPAPQRGNRRMARLGGSLQVGQAPVNQVVAHMRGSVVAAVPCRTGACKLDGAPGDRLLRTSAGLRDFFDAMAVTVTAGEIHAGIGLARVGTQGLFDQAHGLNELAPVHGAEESQAADAVADRHLIGRLLLIAGVHHLLDVEAGLSQLLFDPGQRQGQGGTVALQAAHQLRYERRGHGRIRARHVCDHQDQILRLLARGLGQPVRPGDPQVPIHPAFGDAHRDAAQILNQRQTQHDGNRPQLAQAKGCDGLVSRNETAERVRVHPSVAVGNGLEHEVIHPRQAGRRALGQGGQLPAIAFGQVTPGDADLFLDEVEVIEQPFSGGRDAVARCHCRRQQLAGFDYHALVGGQARQQPVRHASRCQAVRRRKAHPVLFHLLGTKQLRPQRRLLVERPPRQAASTQLRPRQGIPYLAPRSEKYGVA